MSTLRVNALQNVAGTGQPAMVGAAKAWVNFNGSGTVFIRSQFNVSSITDIGTGQFRINFTTAFSDTNYSTVASAIGSDFGNPGSSPLTNVGNANNSSSPSPTTTSVAIGCWSNNDVNLRDPQYVSVVVFR